MNTDKIIENFGKKFHSKLVEMLPIYTERWQLSNLVQIDYYSLSCLFSCASKRHGMCILKIGTDEKLTEAEFHTLQEFNGDGMCKVHEADIDNGVLLLERITPGTQLFDEPDQNTRINAFCELAKNLHKTPKNPEQYDSCIEIIRYCTTFIQTRPEYAALHAEMAHAEEIFQPLWEKYTQRELLHGDLYHDNILLGVNGYIAIDPLGVIGDPIFDILLFILDEIDWDIKGNYEHIVQTICTKMSVNEQDIRALLYVELCALNCLLIEEGHEDEVDLEEILLIKSLMTNEVQT
ncbi:MAG: aminoglycoside phosphotransferase family protein [Defluviitaleaceae bacterium]|nr:aminoglycoside phosphotransferase family protein [Defluviitaleaceae bacterium]MCL2275199.1 aminoglycoside phosphotransferase family protein [Defluviitaleaceae bacterium]